MKTLILFLFTIGCFAQDTIPKIKPDRFVIIEGEPMELNWWGLNYRDGDWYLQRDYIDLDFNHFEYECRLEEAKNVEWKV